MYTFSCFIEYGRLKFVTS